MDIFSNLLSDTTEYTNLVQLFLFLTTLMFLPMIIFMMTSFVRIIITFSFLKSALGVQQSIPNQILIGLSIVLTIFIMTPVLTQINDEALQPYLNKEIKMEEFLSKSEKPIKKFLLKQTRQKDLELFIDNTQLDKEKITKENVPLYVVVPAFATSELKTAFEIGFLIYIPFIIIDLVVSSILMSMGMFMLPPAMISLPFKLLLFIMVDGWSLIIKSLINSF
jgi:flagellar biosynthetic protein FliP